jgi:hypothetical protein
MDTFQICYQISKCWTDFKYFVRSVFYSTFKVKYFVTVPTIQGHTYPDVDEKLLHTVMQILCDYIEKEHEGNDWEKLENNEETKDNFKAYQIYKWWKNYPQELAEINKLYELPSRTFEKIQNAEEELTNKENEMLIDLIKIRGSLWS